MLQDIFIFNDEKTQHIYYADKIRKLLGQNIFWIIRLRKTTLNSVTKSSQIKSSLYDLFQISV